MIIEENKNNKIQEATCLNNHLLEKKFSFDDA